MIDVCLLGTGGMMPLPYRYLTAMMARYNGKSILIDCGEGTQIAMKQKGWSPKPIDVICFTHFHADHISGLPGMLLTMGNAERTEPLLIIGPKGLEKVVGALRMIAPELPFELRFHELSQPFEQIDMGDYRIEAFRVNHNVICYGYNLIVERAGRFQVERAKALGLPVQLWNPLQKGNVVEFEGKTYTPDMVMGSPRKGIKVTYCTDTRPTRSIEENAAHADLFICEGMYGEPDKQQKAREHKHMTFYEAANLAKAAEVSQMWLTHYSPSLPWPDQYLPQVTKIFPNAITAKDGQTIELDFEEEKAEEDRKKAIVPFQLAYAVSIHKAQGLEYRSVKVVIPSSNAEKITHGIFYTAITRAKEKLKIYWSSETMQEVVAGFSVDTSRQKSLAIIKEKLKQDKNT